jgi:secondary thiamine-phosphate synthase enzyme
MSWIQREIRLKPFPAGCHPITRTIVDAIAEEIREYEIGLLHLFLQHTSASLTLNENADPDVPDDLDRLLSSIAPESFPYRHTLEGPDDMPAHAKTALTDSNLTIPIGNGRLRLGTWQGIFLWEHRQSATGRRIIATISGSRYKEEA